MTNTVASTLSTTNNITSPNLKTKFSLEPLNIKQTTNTLTTPDYTSYIPTVSMEMIEHLLKQISGNNWLSTNMTTTTDSTINKKQVFTKTHLYDEIIKKYKTPQQFKTIAKQKKIEEAKKLHPKWKKFKWEEWENKYGEKKDPLSNVTLYNKGFFEVKLYSLQVKGNRTSALSDAVYKSLIRKTKETNSLQFESRFNMLLKAKLGEDVEVNYNIVQEPNRPQKNDISLRIRKTQINFGDIQKHFSIGNITDISKKIDGISVKGNEGSFKYNLGFGQEKSKKDSYSRKGNGTSEYPLKNKPILEGSLSVWVNDVKQKEGTDYQIDNFEGKVIFSTAKSSADTIKFSYDYTNPIEDFIPIASNVNFLGLTGKYSTKELSTKRQAYRYKIEEIKMDKNQHHYELAKKPIRFASEIVIVEPFQYKSQKHYYINYEEGNIYFPRPNNTTVSIRYQYPLTTKRKETINGKGLQGTYYLKYTPMLEDSETIIINNVLYEKNVDYQIDYQKGRLAFLYPIDTNSKIKITYQELKYETIRSKNTKKDNNYDISFGYFKEYAKAQKDINTKLISDTFNSPTKNSLDSYTLSLSSWPVVPNSIYIYVDNRLVSDTKDYKADYDKGTITLNNNIASSSIRVDYHYYKEYGPAQWVFTGVDPYFEYNIIYDSNRTAHKLESKFEHAVKYDRDNTEIIIEYKNIHDLEYRNLIYGKDYTISYEDPEINPGQINIILFTKYTDYTEGTSEYGVPNILSLNDLFRITYKYNKSNLPDPGEIIHEQVAAAYNHNFSKNLKLSIDLARTNKEYSRGFVSTTNYIIANGKYRYTYSLNKGDIVENSETVYINDDLDLIRNEDYYINYKSGKLTFININPNSSDDVKVDYSYYTTSAENLRKTKKSGTALNLETEYKNSFSDTKIKYINIEDAYMPLGASKYTAGSNIIELKNKLNLLDDLSVKTGFYSNTKYLNEVKLDETKIPLTEEKIKIGFAYKPSKMFKSAYEWEKIDNVSDINNSISPNKRTHDNITLKNTLKLEGGPQNFYSNFSLSTLRYNDDYKDKVNQKFKIVDSWQYNNKLIVLNNTLTFKSLFSELQELNNQLITKNHKTKEFQNNKQQFDLKWSPNKNFFLNSLYKKETNKKYDKFDDDNKPISANSTHTVIENYKHNAKTKIPIDIFIMTNPDYNYSISKKEVSSILLNQSSSKEYNFYNDLNFKTLNLTKLRIKNSRTHKYESNERIHQKKDYDEYSLAGFRLIKDITYLYLKKYNYKKILGNTSNKVPKGSVISNIKNNISIENKIGFTWKPTSYIIYDLDYTKSDNDSISTENRTTEIVNIQNSKPSEKIYSNIKLNIKPLNLINNGSYEYNTNEDSTKRYYYPTNDIKSLTKTDHQNKTTHKIIKKWRTTYAHKKIPLYYNYSHIYDDFINSQIKKGLKTRTDEKNSIKSNFLFYGFKLEPLYSNSTLRQYRRISDDIKLKELVNSYDSFLYNNTSEAELTVEKKLSNIYSVISRYNLKQIKEDYEKTISPSIDQKRLNIHGLSVGIISNWIKGLQVSYTYTIKNNVNELTKKEYKNFADQIKITYQMPLTNSSKMKGKVICSYQRDHTWGIGLNDFDKLEKNQINEESIATQIKNINNIISTGKLEANLTIPMSQRSNGMIEKFVFTAEGVIQEKQDLTGESNLTYTVTSLIFTGRIIF